MREGDDAFYRADNGVIDDNDDDHTYNLVISYLHGQFVVRSPFPILAGVTGLCDAQPQSVQSVMGKHVAVARRQKNVVVPAGLLDRVVLARHHHEL